ncbi:putative membrane protein [Vibrio parahaemolyticus 50]|nr:putative membrane protein [Vibrio parahaemolyticus 50]
MKSLFLIVPASLLALLSVIGFQAINPFSKKVWLEPSWDINPFTLSQPLVVFHFLACIVTVQALVNLVISIIKGDLYEFSLIGCVAGLSILAGVRLARIVFRRKFQ